MLATYRRQWVYTGLITCTPISAVMRILFPLVLSLGYTAQYSHVTHTIGRMVVEAQWSELTARAKGLCLILNNSQPFTVLSSAFTS